MVVLNQVQGLNKQAITALFLVIGALIIVGSLYPIGGPRSAADSVVMKRRRKNGRSWFNLRPLMCSRCGSTRIHRSRRWNIEWVLMFVLVRPYRCHSCTTRFYAFVPFVMLKRRVA
jgi:ribosomal protein L37E